MINFLGHINFAQLFKVIKGKDKHGYGHKFLPVILLLRNIMCLQQDPKRLSSQVRVHPLEWRLEHWLSLVTSFLSCNALLRRLCLCLSRRKIALRARRALLGSSRNASPFPFVGEKRCVTTLITALKETTYPPGEKKADPVSMLCSWLR